jgi:hypothetical protein
MSHYYCQSLDFFSSGKSIQIPGTDSIFGFSMKFACFSLASAAASLFHHLNPMVS